MDRRGFLKGLGVLGFGALFGVLPVRAFAASVREESLAAPDVWVTRKLSRMLPEVSKSFVRAKATMLLAAKAVEKAKGLSVADQLAIAFLETRIAEKPGQEKNIVRIEDDTFVGKFQKYGLSLIPVVSQTDVALAARMKAIVAKASALNGLASCRSEIISLRSSAYLSLLFTACRLDDGSREVIQRAGIEATEPFVGNGLPWLVHNVGENYAVRLLKTPEMRANQIMPSKYVVSRDLHVDTKAGVMAERLTQLYVGIRDAFASHLKGQETQPAEPTMASRRDFLSFRLK